jgi:pimeloyl-ACP methyl ester carboxylesterase
MTRYTLLLALQYVGCAHAQPAPAADPGPASGPEPTRTGYVEADGVRYYYEIYGQGEPMLLLHGGLGSIDMFDPVLPLLVEGREVIAVDLQGHGRTNLGDRPFRPVDIGDDMDAVLDELGYGAVNVMGYSMGGTVAQRLAVQHPEHVAKLAVVSAGYAQDGFYPEMLPMQAQVGAGMADMMKDTPMYKSYVAVAPHPEEFPRLLDAVGEWMRTPYDWSEDVKTLQMPVLIAVGDADMIRLDHVVDFYHLVGGGLRDAGWQREYMSQNRLAVIPNVTHYEAFLVPDVSRTVTAFFDGTADPTTWAAEVDEGRR